MADWPAVACAGRSPRSTVPPGSPRLVQRGKHTSMSMVPDGNPFSTCRVRPGSLEFQFPHELPPQQLVARLANQQWWGQIVGAHGVGKSTLLHSWLPLLADAGRTVSWWTLQGGQRRLPAELWRAARSWHDTTLVVVDGYEQLSWLARRRLVSRCRRTRAGLLVTTHYDAGLPTLIELACPLDTAAAAGGPVVAQIRRRSIPPKCPPISIGTAATCGRCSSHFTICMSSAGIHAPVPLNCPR